MAINQMLELNKMEIISRYKAGESTLSIAKDFHCNHGSVWLLLNNNGVELRKRQNYGTTTKNKDKIIRLFNEGASCYKIAKQFKISRTTLVKFLNNNGYDTSRYSTNTKSIKLKDRADEVIEMYVHQKKSGLQISKELGYTQPNINKLLHDNGIETPQEKYTVDEHFFDTLDNEINCYVFGLWLADGCVDTGGKLRLQMTDRDIIERIKAEMNYEGPIYDMKPREAHHKHQYCLSINRKTLADQLIDKGCPPAKSLILDFPTKFNIHCLRHLIRGYFDGDGSISSNLHNVALVGTENFCQGLSTILGLMNINHTIYERWKNRKTTTRQLFINKKDSQIKFLDWIYQNSTIHLSRKYSLYTDLVSKYRGL